MLNELKTCINKSELKNQEFFVATLGRKPIDLLKLEAVKHGIEFPKNLNHHINLKKEIPELKKAKERKSGNNNKLIEEALKVLEL